MSTEKFANVPVTTLNGNITNASSSFNLASASLFPSSGQFRVLIDTEIIIVGVISGTACSSLTREAENTTAANHTSGATITLVLTAGSLVNSPGAMTTQGDLQTLDVNGQATRIAAPTDGNYTVSWASKILTWIKRGMTTLGDFEYMGAGPTPTRLPAPGDGTYSIAFASSIPSWSPVLPNVIPPGVITMYGATAPPSGYLNCDGSAVSRGTFAALFSIIGTTFGNGNGTTTFNLPNFKTKMPLGYEQFVHNLNETGGAFDHTHDMANHTHPGGSHTHTFTTSTASLLHNHNIGQASDAQLGGGGTYDNAGTSDNTDLSHDHTGTTDAGGVVATDVPSTNTTGTSNPPYIVINFIIKT